MLKTFTQWARTDDAQVIITSAVAAAAVLAMAAAGWLPGA